MIIRVGSVRTDMVRTEPYVVVEIPGLTREVVVCNEVGEIAFVAARRMGPDFYASRTKEALRATDGISTVVYHRREQWLAEVTDLLFSGAEFKRINVRDQEALRLALVSMDGMSTETWAKMNQKQKRAFQVPGSEMGLKARATRFGVKGNPVSYHALTLSSGRRSSASLKSNKPRKLSAETKVVANWSFLDPKVIEEEEVLVAEEEKAAKDS